MIVGRKRVVVYVGYDAESARVLRRVLSFRELFDDYTIVYVPESRREVLEGLSIPSILVEDM